MNKSLLVSALLAVAMSGCGVSAETQALRDKQSADWEAERSAHHKITLINDAGVVVREWTSREYVEIGHGVAVFIDAQTNKRVKVGGNFIVEQM